MRKLKSSVLDSLYMDMCRRSTAASLGFSIVLITTLFYPLVTSPSLLPLHQVSAVIALIASLLRFFFAQRAVKGGIPGLRRWGSTHITMIVINTTFLGLMCALSMYDPQNSDTKIFVTSFIISAVMAGSTSSISLAPRVQNYLLITLGIIPGIVLGLSTHHGELPYTVWTLFIFTFILYVYGNSGQFYRNMSLRYETEEELNIEKHNLTTTIQKLEATQEELLFQKARAEYASKLAALGEMAGGIAHEINTPLNVILLLAEQQMDILSQQPLNLDEMKEAIQKIEATTNRIAKIVRGLRTFARDGEKDPIEVTSVRSIIENTLALCYEKFKLNNIVIRTPEPFPDLSIKCRPVQISQVLLNLLNNAYEAIHELDDKWVDIEIQQIDGDVEIRVTDSGPGIPEAIRKEIFRPFFTTKDIGKGTGLGLSISRGLIEGHRGQMYIDPTSKHTSFVIRLPI